ncbi:hypothetical protein BU25DRAFT_187813 [Macroventuria anomochaeta]|uniref:Uncharacterized protein n=1 Tax=Macroventuria anomochaeta TaxID=301207 RepID=A0ACB6SCW6_9PLEO|nr:uncharacterized protein BU25DRAFT_187813 [Macroventuria anomochaeta]KAF2631450.1 hypothetical protein BU25DRAFT_187813 [Macroventuria anomochaeta]
MTNSSGQPNANSVHDHLIHAASSAGDAAAITTLVADSPTDLELRDPDSCTPLLLAVYANKPDAVRALLAAGADSSSKGGRVGNSGVGRDCDAITTAALFGCEEVLKILLEEEWNVEVTTRAFVDAAGLGRYKSVRTILKRLQEKGKSFSDASPLEGIRAAIEKAARCWHDQTVHLLFA